MKLYKAIIGCLTAAALSAGLMSCDNNFDYPPVSMPDFVGNGSSMKPYNVNTALVKIFQGDYSEWRDYYIKGIVSKVDVAAFDASYGNITYYISDDGTENNEFEVYRGLGINGAKFAAATDLRPGDEVVVVCKMTYYNNSVAESKQGAILVSLNGSPYPTFEDAGEPSGDGSAANPFNVLGALEYTFAEDFVTNSQIYVKGIVSYVDASSFSSSYGNINYYISDTGNRFNEYYCYRGLGLNGAKFTSAADIKVGDEVVVYGPVSLFSGATAEFNQGNKIVAFNGGAVDPGQPSQPSNPQGQGTLDSPYNIAKALELLNNKTFTSNEVYIEGIVSSIKEISTSYGNGTYYLSDDGTTGAQLYVYRGYYLGGEKFPSESAIKVGDKLLIKGVLTIYEGTYSSPQVNQGSQIVSINGAGSTPTPNPDPTPDPNPGSGDGSQANPYTVGQVISLNPTSTSASPDGGAGVWVNGFIVGYMPSNQTYLSNTIFGVPTDVKTNIVIAPTADCADYNKCIGIQLPSGAVRTALNLQDNPDNLGKQVSLYGDVMKYCGGPGLKNTSKYEFGQGGSTGGGTTTPDNPATGDAVYSGLIANADGWNFDNVTIPDAASYIWSWKEYNGSGYLNASCYVSGAAYASEAYAYTTVDLKAISSASVTFDHTAKFQTTLKSLCGLVVREAGSSAWTRLAIPTWPDAGAWTFVNSGEISLNAYVGKRIEIGFVYGSTASGADTWEIKNFVVTGK